MNAEITLAAVALVGLLAALLVHDFVSLPRNRRLMLLQMVTFAAGATLIIYPEIARRLARAVGIGRGVDFVLYPLVIWLVRESLLSRRRHHEDQERMTELVRAIAMLEAREIRDKDAQSSGRAPLQSAGSSAS